MRQQHFAITGLDAAARSGAPGANNRPCRLGRAAAWWCLVAFGFLAFACQSEARRPPAAPTANVVHPVVYLPADLDLVLHLNVQKFRESMGPDPELSLVRLWESFGPNSEGSFDTHEPLLKLLKGCNSLWLGCRLSEKGCRDFVFVLRGQWSGTYRDYGFGTEHNRRDLGAGWLSFDHALARRSSFARLYWRAPELAVLVSTAELDSTERTLEQSRDATTLEPSEDGVMSLVARSTGLARLVRPRSPKGAEWLGQSERIEIRFEPTGPETIATFTVLFDDADKAKLSAEAFRILVTALSGFDARFKASNVVLELLGTHVVLRVRLPTLESGSEVR